MKRFVIFMMLYATSAFAGAGQYNCSVFNYTPFILPPQQSYVNTVEHITGNHTLIATRSGSCQYGMAQAGGGNCPLSVSAMDSPSASDHGLTITLDHVIHTAVTGGFSAGMGPLTAVAKAGAAVEDCILHICSFNVSLGPSGVSVSSGRVVWSAEDTASISCQGKSYPNNSPIIIDTVGEGFKLTNVANGVRFDIQGDNKPVRVAWTAADSNNAFLAIDNNGDGKITSGKELFGNWSPQEPSDNPNGFAALGEYDKPENGGNGDGRISSADSVYSRLRLWIDRNHNGIAEPAELYTLKQFGIVSISLKYREASYADPYDNVFRYRGHIMAEKGVDRTVWDVFLQTK